MNTYRIHVQLESDTIGYYKVKADSVADAKTKIIQALDVPLDDQDVIESLTFTEFTFHTL